MRDCSLKFLGTEALPSSQACSEPLRPLIPASSGGVKASRVFGTFILNLQRDLQRLEIEWTSIENSSFPTQPRDRESKLAAT